MRVAYALRLLAACTLVTGLIPFRSAAAQCNDVIQSASTGQLLVMEDGMGMGSEVGQSFTTPASACYLYAISVSVNSASNTWNGTLRVYQGEGFGGSQVASEPFSFTGTGTKTITLSTPVQLSASTTYSFFLDFTTASNSGGNLAVHGGNPYAGGQSYLGSTGPSNATARSFEDLVFTADLDQNLPVELTSFTATTDGGSARLTWATASETNNAGFAVEQQAGASWREVAFVAGRGTTAKAQRYSYRVERLAPGTHTFRLRQVDFDGSTSYSPTVEVTVGLDEVAKVDVRGASVRFTVRESQAVRVEAFNAIGQRVALLFDGEAAAGQATALDVPSGLSPGVYLVRVAGRSFSETARFVVR